MHLVTSSGVLNSRDISKECRPWCRAHNSMTQGLNLIVVEHLQVSLLHLPPPRSRHTLAHFCCAAIFSPTKSQYQTTYPTWPLHTLIFTHMKKHTLVQIPSVGNPVLIPPPNQIERRSEGWKDGEISKRFRIQWDLVSHSFGPRLSLQILL